MDRPTKLAFVDTETTGLNHLSRPWEIAVILRETAQIEATSLASEFHQLIAGEVAETEYVWHVRYSQSSLPEGSEPGALEIGGWHDRGHGILSAEYLERTYETEGVLTGAGPEFAIARRVHEALQGATLVGIGVHYDAEVLGRMFLRHGLEWHPWHYGIYDLKAATHGYLRGQRQYAASQGHGSELYPLSEFDQVPVKSERIAEYLGVKPPTDEERHTALGDARWAARWWDAL